MANVAQRVIDTIAEKILIERERLVPSAAFKADLEIDSLDIAEMVEELESEFNIAIPDEHVENIKTIGQLIDYIEQHVKH